MIGSYSLQSSMARTTCGPHVKSRTLEIEPRIHIIKFYQWLKFVVDDSNWQPGRYSLQSSVARTTREFHVKSRTLEIEPPVHIIKFYHWLKFVGDDSNYITATLCTIVWVDKHVGPISRAYTHGFKRHMGQSRVGYLVELLSWGWVAIRSP